MGAELYAHFSVTSDAQIESDQLRELAEDRAPARCPGRRGGPDRRSPGSRSKVAEGKDSELWLDAARIHLFEPDTGDSLAS